MSASVTPFKRHSRAQGVNLTDAVRSSAPTSLELSSTPPSLSSGDAHRRSRVLHVRQTPSWISSKRGLTLSPEGDTSGGILGEAERLPSAPRQAKETTVVSKSDWVHYVKLGFLVQGGRELCICRSREDQRLYMLKDVGDEVKGRAEKIGSLQHRHIALASFQIDTDSTSYIAFPYTRHTLEELLHTHVMMEESHIRAIALPVFQAIKHLHERAFLHGSVNAQSIRICGRTGAVVLGDCDSCEKIAKPSGADLEGLGIALLNCMEGCLTALTVTRVTECRASNKVFGLSDPERWSEHKQLVDFVDDIFSSQRKHVVKFLKPHAYVAHESWDPHALVPLAELASLECFTLWHAAQ